ncbi:uncharacterized protein PG986_011252 [Apiospora aurea]|uniref:DUF7791 domain-containing protein n=1 Tax=Apiospora aurea TaxID=335848 RepID=A0ABR1Q511_9PEZI
MQVFILDQFNKQPRFRILSQGDNKLINTLLNNIITSSSGVFLWVCLVVTEVLEEARDGASMAELIEIVEKVPNDINDYFYRIMDSIEPKYKAESSIMLQITLHDGKRFVNFKFLQLLDLSFIEEHHCDFALRPGYSLAKYDISAQGICARIGSASRRVNSRCGGLLKTQYTEGRTEKSVGLGQPINNAGLAASTESGPHNGEYLDSRDSTDLVRTYNYHVNFLHRSFYDYLREPENMEQLTQRAKGRYNVRLFLCNAKLVQILSLNYKSRPDHARLPFGLVSYVLSVMSVDDLKYTKECLDIATRLRPVVEFLAQKRIHKTSGVLWYLSIALQDYDAYRENFLAVAIEFDLVAYLKEYLTLDAVLAKTGRPLLGNVLKHAIFHHYSVHLPDPNAEVLRLVLDRGAGPNEMWHSSSIWGLFLTCLAGARS